MAGEPNASVARGPRIVHADEWLAVIDKPPGLVVHAAPGHHGTTLVDALGDLLAGGQAPKRPGGPPPPARAPPGPLTWAPPPEAPPPPPAPTRRPRGPARRPAARA